jgi:hypothetical protein
MLDHSDSDEDMERPTEISVGYLGSLYDSAVLRTVQRKSGVGDSRSELSKLKDEWDLCRASK